MQRDGGTRSPRSTSPRSSINRSPVPIISGQSLSPRGRFGGGEGSPRGEGVSRRSPRNSPRGASSPRSSVRAREVSNGSSGKAKTTNKMTPRASPRESGSSAASPEANTNDAASTEERGLAALESLRVCLREDTQLIVDTLGARMEKLQRELMDSQARSIAESMIAWRLEPARARDDLGARKDLVPPITPSPGGPLPGPWTEELNGGHNQELGEGPRRRPSQTSTESVKQDVEARRNIANRLISCTNSDAVMDVFHKAGDSFSSMNILAKQDAMDQGLTTKITQVVYRWLDMWAAIEKPESDRLIARIVRSMAFSVVCSLMISLNAIYITVSTDYEIQNPGSSDQLMVYGEYCFICWYAIELAMKIAAEGKYFFAGSDYAWNIFDFILVVFSAVQLTVMTGAVNLGFIRSLRLFKISKIFRLFRALEFLQDVKVMVYCMVHSLLAVFWALVLIVFLLYMFTIIILQGVILSIEDGDNTTADMQVLADTFPSVSETMMLLYQTTTGGRDWSELFNVLNAATWWTQLVYVLFVSFFAIAVWNIVTAIFIEKAMGLTEPDRHEVMMRDRRTELRDAIELREILAEVDEDDSNTLTPAEFEQVCNIPEFRFFLDSRGIHIKEAGTFFAMVAQSVGAEAEIDIDTMIGCCLRCRGHATSIDLHTLRFEMKATLAEQRRTMEELMLHMGVQSRPTSPKAVKRRPETQRGAGGSADCAPSGPRVHFFQGEPQREPT